MSTTFENGYALLIGVSDQLNADQAAKLPETANDVTKLAQILLDPKKGGYQKDKVKVLLGQKATKINIIMELIWLQENLEKNPNATAIVYFSGHGYLKKSTQKYYLIPYDFNKALPNETALEGSYFSEKLNALNAQRLLLLMDCCHAGETGALSAPPTDFDQQAAALTPFLLADPLKEINDDEKQEDNPSGSKPINDDEKQEDNPSGSKPINDDEKQEDNPSGSKPIGEASATAAAPATRAVLVSSRGSEKSYIHKEAQMSVFTYHLIEALNGHGKQAAGNTTVNVADLMSYVSDKVPGTAKAMYDQSQTPNFHFSGEKFPIALLMGGEGVSEDQQPESVEQALGSSSISIKVDGDGNVVAENITIGGNQNIDNSTGKKTAGSHSVVADNVNVGGDFNMGGGN